MNRETAIEKVAAQAAKHANDGATTNQRAFAAWLLDASGYVAKTDAERAAFLAAAQLAPHSYKHFQTSKPTSALFTSAELTPEPVAPVVKAKPVRKSPAKKVEPVVEPEPVAKAAPVRKPRAARKTTTAKAWV